MFRKIFTFFVLILLMPIAYADVTDADLQEYLGDKGVGTLKKYGEKLGTDTILGQEMSLDMQALMQDAKSQFEESEGHGSCELAANRRASWALNELSREYLKGGIRALIGVFKDVLGIGTGGAGALTSWLQGQAEGRANADIQKWLGEQPDEIYTNERFDRECSVTERIIWDKEAGTFEMYLSGDCECKSMPYESNNNIGHVELNDWVVYISADIKVTLSEDGKEATYSLENFEQQTYANCGCGEFTDETIDGSDEDEPEDGGGGGIPEEDEPEEGEPPYTPVVDEPKRSAWQRFISIFGFGDSPEEVPEVEEEVPVFEAEIDEPLPIYTDEVIDSDLLETGEITEELVESDLDDIFEDDVNVEDLPEVEEEVESEPEPEIEEPEPEPEPEEEEDSCDMSAFNSCMSSFDIDACYAGCELIEIDCLPGDHPDAVCYAYSEACQDMCTTQVEIDCRASSGC